MFSGRSVDMVLLAIEAIREPFEDNIIEAALE